MLKTTTEWRAKPCCPVVGIFATRVLDRQCTLHMANTQSEILFKPFFQGKFTPKSDAWSFAVCLWEILTFAREQPYDDMRDEQVIENLGHIFHDTGSQVWTWLSFFFFFF